MTTYAVLLRGINVGGKNKVPMAALKACLEDGGLGGGGFDNAGFDDVATYIQSGNVILRSEMDASDVGAAIERILPAHFALDSAVVRVLAIPHAGYREIVSRAPDGFGEDPVAFRYNVVFLMGIDAGEALSQITTREGVDAVWPGPGVLYFRNSAVDASKSHLSRIVQKPIYPSLTIRNWNTTTKLLALLDEREG